MKDMLHWLISSQMDEFRYSCIKYSDEKGIKELSQSFLNNCLEVPMGGITVKNVAYDTVHYPLLNPLLEDERQLEKIGAYNIRKGVVVFVYRDGRTMVAKANAIPRVLKYAEGYYRDKRLFVPLAEMRIIDEKIGTKWDGLAKISI